MLRFYDCRERMVSDGTRMANLVKKFSVVDGFYNIAC